jgi:anti-anti-sigma regulatory factor
VRAGPAPVYPWVRVISLASRGQALVILRGEIDIAARPALLSVAAWLVDHDLSAVVDASRTTFLDCAGWSAVCMLTPEGSEPLLRRPSPAVLRLLALLALHATWRDRQGAPG